jgi:uncharacterized protein GlcG (DUF336 family)
MATNEIFRAPEGEELTKIAQTENQTFTDATIPAAGIYDYALRPVKPGGQKGDMTARQTRTVWWAPDFVTGLAAHLDAARTNVEQTISKTNGNVDTWHDASGSDDATQTTDGNRPTHGNVTKAGEPVVSFESGESLNLSISQMASYVLGMVFRADGDTVLTGDVPVGKSGGSWDALGISGGTADTDWHVLTLAVSSGAAVLSVDGTRIGETGILDGDISTITIEGTNLDVAELVITDGLVDTERLTGYLAYEWGLEDSLRPLQRFKTDRPLTQDPHIYPDPQHTSTLDASAFEKEELNEDPDNDLPADPVFYLNPGGKQTLLG